MLFLYSQCEQKADSMHDILIRDERQADYPAIGEVTRLAFEDHPFSQHTEQRIIEALRASGALSLSLVAELEGRVVGHIAFSPVTISDGTPNWYGVGPVSVTPALQRRGIGSKLAQAGLERLQTLGGKGCALVGDVAFYGRFGFRHHAGLTYEGVPPEVFLALAFEQQTAFPQGIVTFHEAFAVH
jgi:putative acetyltransferase